MYHILIRLTINFSSKLLGQALILTIKIHTDHFFVGADVRCAITGASIVHISNLSHHIPDKTI